MKNNLETLAPETGFETPVVFTEPESWHWKVLAKAFITDPTIKFWFDGKEDEDLLESFFEAVVKDVLMSGGTVFSSADRKAVFVWAWLGNTDQKANTFKEKWHGILGETGVKRYNWLYDAGNIHLDPDKVQKSMEPAYLAVLPEAQGRGYGSYLFKWTLDYFDRKGYDAPFILASTRRSAKLYCPLLGYDVCKEVFVNSNDTEPIGVFLKRKK